MNNRQLERQKDTIEGIINDLVSEIESLETTIDTLQDKLEAQDDEIRQLREDKEELAGYISDLNN